MQYRFVKCVEIIVHAEPRSNFLNCSLWCRALNGRCRASADCSSAQSCPSQQTEEQYPRFRVSPDPPSAVLSGSLVGFQFVGWGLTTHFCQRVLPLRHALYAGPPPFPGTRRTERHSQQGRGYSHQSVTVLHLTPTPEVPVITILVTLE